MEMSRLTRDGTAEPVSRDQILRHARGQGNVHFPCSADHEQDWQPYPVDPYSAICDDHTYIHTYIEKAYGKILHPYRRGKHTERFYIRIVEKSMRKDTSGLRHYCAFNATYQSSPRKMTYNLKFTYHAFFLAVDFRPRIRKDMFLL